MATFTGFEEIDAWKKARQLCNTTFRLIMTSELGKDFGLRDQINRSSGSIMVNIAEGSERGGNKEFIQFLFIAKSSNSEFKSQLYRILDRNYINEEEFKKIMTLSNEISKMIGGLIKYLKQSDLKGSKFK
ncbi:MAG TPA: four helix bundle protein [Bacteroidales bacterium]|nr:four helix bundle protein [Bacteroidales bacterium]